MMQENYECGYQLVSKVRSNWARVDDATGHTRYEGTYEGAQRWLHDRGVYSLSLGYTHEVRRQQLTS